MKKIKIDTAQLVIKPSKDGVRLVSNKMSSDCNFVDIFAGGGGLSEGFMREGFQPVALIDKDVHSCNTLRTRTAYWWLKRNGSLDLYREYLRDVTKKEEFYSQVKLPLKNIILNTEITKETLKSIIRKIKSNMNEAGVKHIQVLVGGPPCQAYSRVGKARLSKLKADFDPRAFLYILYIKMIDVFRPNFFVFENVPAMNVALNGDIMKDLMRRIMVLNYEVEPRILDAKRYFVLQKRKRIFMVGWPKEADVEYPDPQQKNHEFLVADILNDLPHIMPGEGQDVMDYKRAPNLYLESSEIRKCWDILTHHVARPHNHHDIKIYKIAIKLWNEKSERLKYNDLPGHLQTHRNRKSFLDRFKVVAENKKFSHTLVAHIAKDGHYYIHPDIKQTRSLTVREAARIQSFPDDYFFEGPRTSKFRQVGNAVPPLLAQAIATKIQGMVE